jgi:hypothetical protein
VVDRSIIADGSAGSEGGGMYLDTNSSANVSGSTLRDCRARDGGGLHLNGDVTLKLRNVTMERNAAFGSRGGALNAAGALGRNTVEAHGGMFVNNSAAEFGGMACLLPASVMVMDGLAEVVGSLSSGFGGGIYAGEGSFVVLHTVVVRRGWAGASGGGLFLYERSNLVATRTSIDSNAAVTDGGGVIALLFSTVDLREGASVSDNTASRYGGGVFVRQGTLTVSGSSIDNNVAGMDSGGVNAVWTSTVELLDGSSVSGNLAVRHAGGLWVRQTRLTINGSAVNNNSAGGERGGVVALSFSNVNIFAGSSVSGNTAGSRAGGLAVSQSTLVVSQSNINNNVATKGHGGGVLALLFSTVNLREGTSVIGNKASSGGGLYVEQSTLVVSGSVIDDNTAGVDGGGVQAQTSSTVTLGDGASVSRNTAHGNGGGLSLLLTSSLAIAGRVSVRGNAATGSTSIGGGIAASTSTVRLGSGCAAEIANNTAAADGGALALTENSTLSDSGDAALACLLTVHNNAAAKGSGGGLVVSGDSVVTLGASTAVFSQNTAAQQGGGLFIRAGQSEFDASKATYSIVAKSTFWRLDLVGNTAMTGDGGGKYSVSFLLPFWNAKCQISKRVVNVQT